MSIEETIANALAEAARTVQAHDHELLAIACGVDPKLYSPQQLRVALARVVTVAREQMLKNSGGWDECPFCLGEPPCFDLNDEFRWHSKACLLRLSPGS